MLKSTELLGKILIDAEVLSDKQVKEALDEQIKSGVPLGRILIDRKYCTVEEVISAYALQIGVRYIKLSDFDIDEQVVQMIPADLARKHIVFPVHVKNGIMLLAMEDPGNKQVIQAIEFFLNCKVEPVIASAKEILEAISQYYHLSVPVPEDVEDDAQVEKKLELKRLREEQSSEFRPGNIIGRSKVMVELYRNIYKVAHSNATVLLLGESGTGKEVIAEAIHEASDRKNCPFIKVSCAALPESLLESELFGHEKGSFTGAIRRRLGRFELANGGTLFLDEIGELSLNIQVKLLRVLQQRMITRLGGMESIPIDVRILAATNRNLKKAVDEGHFRNDLYYRLNVISFMIPPLRKRKEDIPLLVKHFLDRFNKRENKKIVNLDPQVSRIFYLYGWPGNVRELENCVERAVVMTDDAEIHVEHLPYNFRELSDSGINDVDGNMEAVELSEKQGLSSLEQTEKKQILKTLKENRWNMNMTASLLGIHRNTLRRKLLQYEIVKPNARNSP